MTILEINGKRVEVDDNFKSMSPEQQEATVQEIARSMGLGSKPAQEGFMGQLNAGIAGATGGFVDFVNPFSRDVWQDTPLGMGSAEEAVKRGMRGIGAYAADEAPDTIPGAFARGGGEALGMAPALMGGLRMASRGAGILGGAAKDALGFLTPASVGAPGVTGASTAAQIARAGRVGVADTLRGAGKFGAVLATEGAMGGLSEGAARAVEEGGGGELAQNLARLAAPLSIPGAAALGRGAVGLAEKTPIAGYMLRAGRDVVRSLVPTSEVGARRGAQQRLEELAGGPARLRELAAEVDPNDPLGRTPAQQTGDPNLLGLERAAAAEQPLIRESLDARAAGTRQVAADQLREGAGPVGDARTYFDERLSEFRTNLTGRADRAIADATGPDVPESEISTRMVGRLKTELDNALLEERSLWESVPDEVRVSTNIAATKTQGILDKTSWGQRRDVPADLREAFGPNGALGEETSVRELHGLYSELRRISRNAMAGTDPNANRARIAREVAEAILEDLGAVDAVTPTGKLINDARAFSRTLNETFDQGDVGDILQRTRTGDNTMTPEGAMRRTVGRTGPDGMVAARNIEDAAPGAAQDVQNYMRSRFSAEIMGADGTFSAKRAATWLRDNRETLARYPELKAQLNRALSSKSNAERFIARSEASALARFNTGKDGEAVQAIFGADKPAEAALSLVRTARRDPTGKAMAGVKGAVSDFLIGKSDLSGEKLNTLLRDPEIIAAIKQVYSGQEISRMLRISSQLAKAEVAARDVGNVLDSPANKALEYVTRYLAVQATAGKGNSAGASLQIANMASGRAKEMLTRLTNDSARQLLLDAVENPQLFKDLSEGVFTSPTVQRSLAPYLAGIAGAAAVDDGEPVPRQPMSLELTNPGNQ